MNHWLLRIELEGEWEECSYATQAEALSAFAAVAADYGLGLSSAVLISNGTTPPLHEQQTPKRVYVN